MHIHDSQRRWALALGLLLGTASAASAQIAQEVYLKASNPNAFDNFGQAVAISGDTLAISAPREDNGATGVDGSQQSGFIVNSGAVYVFVRSGTTWSQEAYIKASNTGAGDHFGWDLALDGDTLVVGAYWEDSAATGVDGIQIDDSAHDAGAAYVFRRSGSTWVQEAYLKASNTGGGDQFGEHVDVSGDRVIVGAISEDSIAIGVDGLQVDNTAQLAGAAYVFVRSGTTWTQEAYLKASNTGAGDQFGSDVAIDGDLAVVGAANEDSSATGIDGDQADDFSWSSGAAYVFSRASGSWTQAAYLKAQYNNANDEFGFAVDVCNSDVIVGAPYEDSLAEGVDGDGSVFGWQSVGAAYLFTESGGTWSQQAYLKPHYTGPYPAWGDLSTELEFGQSVALFGDRALVGAGREPSGGKGIGANPDNKAERGSGAAFSFDRIGTTWNTGAFLKASNAEGSPDDGFGGPGGDRFGGALALAGDTAVVGARLEDGVASGIDGIQDNGPSSSFSGAAYGFDLAATHGAFRYGEYDKANVSDLYRTWYSDPVAGASFTLQLDDFAQDGPAAVLISLAQAQIPYLGGLLLSDPALSVFGPGSILLTTVSATEGQLVVPIPPGLQGLSFFAQAAAKDPLQTGGLALSNGLRITVGP